MLEKWLDEEWGGWWDLSWDEEWGRRWDFSWGAELGLQL